MSQAPDPAAAGPPIGLDDGKRPLSVGLFIAVFLPTAGAVLAAVITLLVKTAALSTSVDILTTEAHAATQAIGALHLETVAISATLNEREKARAEQGKDRVDQSRNHGHAPR